MKCKSCGAQLETGNTTCKYCGNKNDIDLKGIHEFTVSKPETERVCPNCNKTLQTIDIKSTKEHFYIEQCESCFGLFFDPEELAAILNSTISNSIQIDYDRLGEISKNYKYNDNVVYKKCPVCRDLMNRKNFGTRSGVIIDTCKKDGIWLDGGELKRLMEWKKAGGMLLNEERAEQKKVHDEKMERRRSEQRKSFIDSSYAAGGGAYYSRHDNSNIDIFTLENIGKAIFKLFT